MQKTEQCTEYYVYVDDKYVITRLSPKRPTDIVVYVYKSESKTTQFRQYIQHLISGMEYPSDHNNLTIKYIDYVHKDSDEISKFLCEVRDEFEDRINEANKKYEDIKNLSVFGFIKHKYFSKG